MSPAPFSPAALERELTRLIPGWPHCRLVAAFSGGADSVALLAALAELRATDGRSTGEGARLAKGGRRRRELVLRCVHVNHGLHPNSGDWERSARRLARRLGVPFSARRILVEVSHGASLEASARDARYGALSASLRPGEWLVTAHHEDDQAETLLLQLLRGAGVTGLAGMPASMPFAGGRLIRPLLGVSRSALRKWVAAQALPWVEDASNKDERFDRNFLRRRILPPLTARWPRSTHVIARAAGHLGEARILLAELADRDLDMIEQTGTLDVERLLALSGPRQRNLVRRWLERRDLPAPDRLHLERVVGELCAARADALPVVGWRGAEVRRWRQRLYCMRPLGPPPPPLTWRPRKHSTLELPEGLGSLELVPDAEGPIAMKRLPAVLQVSFRAGGERLRTEVGGPTRRLKEVLRAGGVLPWMRDRIPLLHARGRLFAVADLWCSADAATTDESPRVRIAWRDAPTVKTYPAPAPAASCGKSDRT